ncbi:hypothetical protein BSF38_04253 [Paludisphaera borealis]|uniref:SCP domain-containing protein n=1 Tax=Paludisphaera borealis TaxID=1387353 RepID=A0A1U7CUU7_9BACT|nr:hypothetical protein BSF38_04253 [Paludisphaera borealis]
MLNFTHELRTLTRLFLSFTAVFAASSRVEAQQYVYYPTANTATVAAPTYTVPTYTTPATQTAGAVQYYQPAAQVQYAQPTYQTQYYQSAYAGMEVQAQPVQAQAPAAAPAASSGDSYGFTAWLNGVRASYGLGAVGYDGNLESWAAMNNSQQSARGLGHHVMGPARRQNSAMGGFPGIESMWMASPAHRAALLDPTITFIGIAGAGAWWTFNAY